MAIRGVETTASKGRPMTADSLAIQLIRCMPSSFSAPEISAEDDGDIALDWIASRHRSISVSVGTSSRLPYAWIDDGSSVHGVAEFDGWNFPPVLSDLIRHHFPDIGNMVTKTQPKGDQ